MDDSNPFAADMMEDAKMAEPEFIINVVVNDDGKITHAFAGDMVCLLYTSKRREWS